MKKLILAIMMVLSTAFTAVAAPPDPVAMSKEALGYWESIDFKAHFTSAAGYNFLSGARMQAYLDFYPGFLVENFGTLSVNFVGLGGSRSYDWKTAVRNTAILQREMVNNDYKKMFLLLADHVAWVDTLENPKNAMHSSFFLMFIINQIGQNQSPHGNPLIVYLASATSPTVNKVMAHPIPPNSPWGKFWQAIVTGDKDTALSTLRAVPDSRLNELQIWHMFQSL